MGTLSGQTLSSSPSLVSGVMVWNLVNSSLASKISCSHYKSGFLAAVWC